MKRKLRMGFLNYVLLLPILSLHLVSAASAKLIRVPQDVSSVSGAFYLSHDGDEIVVSPGIYKGKIVDYGQNINVHSIDPTNWDVINTTIIEGEGPITPSPVINLGSTSIRLAGFTIRNGGASGILGGGPNSVIEYCHIMDNAGGAPSRTMSIPISPKAQPRSSLASDDRHYGGGICGCSGTIQNCIIERNFAEIGGGIYGCSGTIQNNFIVRNRLVDYWNRGATGAAMCGCDGKIRGNTIVDNGIGGPGPGDKGYVWRGGGLSQCNGVINNNIIWVSEPGFTPEFTGCSTPTYSCIKGWTGGGKGNINTDPVLINAQFDKIPGGTDAGHVWPNQDWRLQPESPCIDAGQTTSGLTADFYGKTRGKAWRSDKLHGDGTHTDMGAHEFQPDKLTLWVPRSYEPLIAGYSYPVKWAMQAGAGSSFSLKLFKADTQLADYGQFTATSGHVDYDTAASVVIKLPAKMITSTEYVMRGQITGSSTLYKSPPFWVMSTSGIQAEIWNMYY